MPGDGPPSRGRVPSGEDADRVGDRARFDEPGDGAAPEDVGGADDEAGRVLRRLERIEMLDRDQAPAGRLLGELRELVREAEAWARLEGDGRARDAVGRLRREAEGMS